MTLVTSRDSGETIGQRLALIRGSMSRPEFAALCGVSKATLERYEFDRQSPKAEFLLKVAARTGVRAAWLLTGEGPMYREGHGPKGAEGGARAEGGQAGAPAAQGAETASARGEGEPPLYKEGRELVASGEFVLVPRYDVRAAAGHGAIVTSEQVVDHLAFRTEWVKRMGLDPKRLALISVVGDSMEPTLSEGDLVLIDTRINSIRSNAIYAIARGDEIVIKRVLARFDGSVKIKSDNPVYEEEEVPPDRVAELRVLGRAVWSGGRM